MHPLTSSLPPVAVQARVAAKARELEGVLLGQFVQLLFKDVDGGLLGGGSAEAQWRDVLAQEYGKAITESGGIGLAVQIERELEAAMGGPTHPPAGHPPAPDTKRNEP
jgi:hypothetical protein